MRPLAKFILIYFACFFILSILSIVIFDKASNEMMAFVMVACLLYTIIGSIGWFLIDFGLYRIHNYRYRFLTGVLAGFILLNGLIFILSGTSGGPNSLFIIYTNVIHLFSFSIASMAFVKSIKA